MQEIVSEKIEFGLHSTEIILGLVPLWGREKLNAPVAILTTHEPATLFPVAFPLKEVSPLIAP